MVDNEDEKRLSDLQSVADVSGHELQYPDEKTFLRVVGCVGEKKLDNTHIKAWIDICPKVLEIASRVLKVTESISEQAGTSQKRIADKIPDTSDILAAMRNLTEMVQSKEERMKLLDALERAHERELKRTKDVKDMNNDNNITFKKIAEAAVIVVTVAIAYTIGALSRRGKS